jgi:1,4-dihydroxy-2-naphthoate octaprenyltransferase
MTKKSKQASGASRAPEDNLPMAVITLGSVFASAALSVLIVQSSKSALWVLFVIGLLAVIVGALWEYSRRPVRRD